MEEEYATFVGLQQCLEIRQTRSPTRRIRDNPPGERRQEHASNVGQETRTFVHKVILPVRTGLPRPVYYRLQRRFAKNICAHLRREISPSTQHNC